MLKEILKPLKRLYGQHSNLWCLLAAAAVLAIDYITGKDVQFPITYIAPIGLAAWSRQKSMTFAMAILMPLARAGFYLPWHEAESIFVGGLNAAITICSLILYAYLIDRLAWQTQALEKKVRVLEGILPVCASCKRIRTEQGEYEQIEKYITEHSEASFSHGICPECARKLYPEFLNEKDT